MESQAPESSVELIYVEPKTDKRCIYTINAHTERHSKKLDAMIEYIIDHIGSQHHPMVYELIYTFQVFVVDVVNKNVVHLRSDIEKEYQEFIEMDRKTRFDIKKIKQELSKPKASPLELFGKQSKNVGMYTGLSRMNQKK